MVLVSEEKKKSLGKKFFSPPNSLLGEKIAAREREEGGGHAGTAATLSRNNSKRDRTAAQSAHNQRRSLGVGNAPCFVAWELSHEIRALRGLNKQHLEGETGEAHYLL